MPRRLALIAVLAASCWSLSAQTPAPAAPADPAAPAAAPATPQQLAVELQKTATQSLFALARTAETNKVLTRAKVCYETIVAQYDPDHAASREALGQRKVKGQWQPGARVPKWIDGATEPQRQKIEAAWTALQAQLAALHRDLGLAWIAAGDRAAGEKQLLRTLELDPTDAKAHQGLGHAERNGFYGTPEQIAFLDRLAAIEARARDLGKEDMQAEPLAVDAMPKELHDAGLTLTGAKTAHVTVWADAPQAATNGFAADGERGHRLLAFLLGEAGAKKHQFAARAQKLRWVALLRNDQQAQAFFKNNAALLEGRPLSTLAGWTHIYFRLGTDCGEVFWPGAPSSVSVVASVAHLSLGYYGNDGLGQGLVHALTWLVLGATNTWYGALPATMAAGSKPVPPKPDGWLPRLRAQIRAGEDFPLARLPLEKLESYRPDARLKGWHATLWLLARHPDHWADLLIALKPKKDGEVPTPELVAQSFQQLLGCTAEAAEAEWRNWALGESPLAKASGHGAK